MNLIILIALFFNGHVFNLVRQAEMTDMPYLANIVEWDGGTMIYASEELAGSEFGKLEQGDEIEAVYVDGSIVAFKVSERGIYYRWQNFDEWTRIIYRFSGENDLTLVMSTNDSNILIKLYPIETLNGGTKFGGK